MRPALQIAGDVGCVAAEAATLLALQAAVVGSAANATRRSTDAGAAQAARIVAGVSAPRRALGSGYASLARITAQNRRRSCATRGGSRGRGG